MVQNCALVQEKNAELQAASKRVTKRRSPEACAITKEKESKGRDIKEAETLASLDSHSLYEIKKATMMLLNN